MSSESGSVLLKIGGLGYVLGFASWILWAIMAILSFVTAFTLRGFPFPFMSGIYFLRYSSLIFYSLLSLSLLFSAIGCFALSRKFRPGLVLASGVVLILAFASTSIYWLDFVGSIPYGVYLVYVFPVLFFLGLILWGATLLTSAEKTTLPIHSRVAGALLVASGVFGMLAWPAILYWGFELWLLMFGWLYAAGALLSALIFFRVLETAEKPTT